MKIKALIFLTAISIAGCAGTPFGGDGENPVGVADYTVKPFVDGNGEAQCCEVTVYNSKNIGELDLTIKHGADGSIEANLKEKSVDAVGPMNAMAEQNVKALELINTMVTKIPILP
jgi:hypothetical protein